jgi:hypothetical protein
MNFAKPFLFVSRKHGFNFWTEFNVIKIDKKGGVTNVEMEEIHDNTEQVEDITMQ